MGWIGLGQNFRKNMDWIGLGWIKKIGPMSNSGSVSINAAVLRRITGSSVRLFRATNSKRKDVTRSVPEKKVRNGVHLRPNFSAPEIRLST